MMSKVELTRSLGKRITSEGILIKSLETKIKLTAIKTRSKEIAMISMEISTSSKDRPTPSKVIRICLKEATITSKEGSM